MALCLIGRQETRNDNVAITLPGRRRRYANTPAGCNWLSRRTRVARYALLGRTGRLDLQQFIFYTKYACDSNVFFHTSSGFCETDLEISSFFTSLKKKMKKNRLLKHGTYVFVSSFCVSIPCRFVALNAGAATGWHRRI